MKDLTKELHFAPEDSTTIKEVKELFERLLNVTWSIGIYRGGTSRVINLKKLGWSIVYNNAKTSAGKCRRKKNRSTGEMTRKTVELSNHFLTQNLEGKGSEWEEVIRHELAHAMDFEIRAKSNHDNHWKAVAREMLSTGERTFSSDDLKDEKASRYTLKCVEEGCSFSRPSHKLRKVNARTHPCCETCHSEGKGLKRLVQVQNY